MPSGFLHLKFASYTPLFVLFMISSNLPSVFTYTYRFHSSIFTQHSRELSIWRRSASCGQPILSMSGSFRLVSHIFSSLGSFSKIYAHKPWHFRNGCFDRFVSSKCASERCSGPQSNLDDDYTEKKTSKEESSLKVESEKEIKVSLAASI